MVRGGPSASPIQSARGLRVSGPLPCPPKWAAQPGCPCPFLASIPLLCRLAAPSSICPLSPAGTSDANGLLSTPSVNGGGGSVLGSAGSGGGPVGSVENGKPGADVVDLTLDSSSSSEEEEEEEEDEEDEDEEGPRPKRRCPFQKGLVSAC